MVFVAGVFEGKDYKKEFFSRERFISTGRINLQTREFKKIAKGCAELFFAQVFLPTGSSKVYCQETDTGLSKRILFVLHDGALMGAPMVLLHLTRWIKGNTDYKITVLFKDGGPLQDEFEMLGDVFMLAPRSAFGICTEAYCF